MQNHHKAKNTNSQISQFELPEDRLATTTDEGDRVYLYPAMVKGFFRTWRTKVYWVLVAVFLGLPWIKVNHTPLIFLDIAHRKFTVFGIHFWAHEAPILVLVFLTFIFLVGLTTTLFGRIWCGWACPQTVFVDGIFNKIEGWIEGTGLARKRFDQSPTTPLKLIKKASKWLLFTLVSLGITHSFLAYFISADKVINIIQRSPSENMVPFLVIAFSTAIILFNFGWFKEQFCIIACPYGRFQSVLLDDHSLIVGYDAKRGEPRKKNRLDMSFKGDCINCYRCVQVCPTGIDIRRGTQMECIMCTACIDACDTVMTKIGKPKGLIRYDSESGLEQKPKKTLRARVWIYSILLTITLSALTIVLINRNMVPTYFKRATKPPYTMPSPTTIQNQFTVSLQNQYFYNIDLTFDLQNDAKNDGITLVQPMASITLGPGERRQYVVFLQAPSHLFKKTFYNVKLTQTIAKNNKSINENTSSKLENNASKNKLNPKISTKKTYEVKLIGR